MWAAGGCESPTYPIQGREARGRFDLRTARLAFKWALKLNPKCATCLKNWAEALAVTPDGSPPQPKLAAAAEDKYLRGALHVAASLAPTGTARCWPVVAPIGTARCWPAARAARCTW